MDKENLSPPACLIVNGFPDDVLIKAVEFGHDGEAVGWRGTDDGKVPGTHK